MELQIVHLFLNLVVNNNTVTRLTRFWALRLFDDFIWYEEKIYFMVIEDKEKCRLHRKLPNAYHNYSGWTAKVTSFSRSTGQNIFRTRFWLYHFMKTICCLFLGSLNNPGQITTIYVHMCVVSYRSCGPEYHAVLPYTELWGQIFPVAADKKLPVT